jgi:hypothetical protein
MQWHQIWRICRRVRVEIGGAQTLDVTTANRCHERANSPGSSFNIDVVA